MYSLSSMLYSFLSEQPVKRGLLCCLITNLNQRSGHFPGLQRKPTDNQPNGARALKRGRDHTNRGLPDMWEQCDMDIGNIGKSYKRRDGYGFVWEKWCVMKMGIGEH